MDVFTGLRRVCGLDLPARTPEALIRRELGDQLIGHIKYDGTAIEAREKAVAKPSKEEQPKRPRGRPRKGEERPAKEPTVLEKQQHQSLDEMLNERRKDCDIGCKKNSKGHQENWRGYQLHIATADGDIPVAALLSSASRHDSGAIVPLMKKERNGAERPNSHLKDNRGSHRTSTRARQSLCTSEVWHLEHRR